MKHAPELRIAVDRALAAARAARRPATVYDLFLSLLQVSEISRMIQEAGGDLPALASALESAPRERQSRGWLAVLRIKVVAGDGGFRRAIAKAEAHTRQVSGTEVRAADVFVAGYDSNNPGLACLLTAAGVSRLRLLRWLASGQPQGSPPALPEGEVLEVVVLNDDYTTMVTVVRILETVFGLDSRTASGSMMEVHRAGSASVGRYPRDEAARLVGAATQMAEAEDAPLRIVLRGPPPPATLPAETAATAWTPQGRRESFLGALLRRLSWRGVSPGGIASSDAMIFACAVVGLGVWLAFDRHAAGADAHWNAGGVTGMTWYVAALLAFTWVFHRTSRAAAAFRALLAAIVGALPLFLAWSLALENWAPADLRHAGYILLALGVLAHLGRTLASVGAGRPLAGMVAATSFVALFAWGTKHVYVYPHLWYANDNSEEGLGAWADSERLLFEQADRIDAAAALLRAGEPDRPDVFFLGFAGMGEEKVFAEEVQLSERVISERYGAAGRTLLLVNDRRDREKWPLATVHGLRRALTRIGARMDRSEDVLLLILTSHGSAEPALSVSNQTWPLDQLDAKSLRAALDESSIKWRVIVISACYSGGFIEPLADENTMIFTSAASDRTSFGCSDDRDVTDFGAAFIRDALPQAPSLVAAFEQAKRALAEQEQRAGMKASLPQAHLGTAIRAHWARVEDGRVAAPLQSAAEETPGP